MINTRRNIRSLLVTGGAGFIGSAFIRNLLLRETEFDGICINFDALTYAGNLENLRSVQDDSRYRFVEGNICNFSDVEKVCNDYAVDAIIHFAAESHVDRSIIGPEAFVETNVTGTFRLLEVARKNPKIHFHHVSTDEVFGSLGDTGYFTEETPYRPNSPYSASKASSDHLVRAYHHTYGLSACISNCSNNYGPFHFPEKLIPLTILNCLERKPLPVYGNGSNVRDWLHVEDHVKALWLLLQKGKLGETYNIGGNAERRNLEVVQEIVRIVAQVQSVPEQELAQLIAFVKDRPGHDLRYAIDSSKIRREFGWSPSFDFFEGLRQTVLWYIANPEWVEHVRTGEYRLWMDANYADRSPFAK